MKAGAACERGQRGLFRSGEERGADHEGRDGEEAEAAEPPLDVLFAVLHDEARPRVYAEMDAARASGLRCDAAYGGRRLKRALELAGRRGAARVVIVGEDEWGAGEAAVRDMTTGDQRRVSLDDLVSELRR